MENVFSLKTINERIRSLDVYPKVLEDFRIKTFGGATVTIISGILMVVLFISELNYYLTPELREELLVDVSRGEKLRINLDVVFPHIACDFLAIDAIDVSGEQHINIEHNVFKRRLSLNGEPLEAPEKDNTIGTKKLSAKKEFLNKVTETPVTTLDPNRCESCYGAESGRRKCCNTCDEVRQAYSEKGWGLNNMDDIMQCKREGIKSRLQNYDKEGCQVFGYVEVNRVGGNLHIAPGKSFTKHHVHVHDLSIGDYQRFNLTHKVRHLSFGRTMPGKTNPLDGTFQSAEEGAMMFQYYIKIVATLYAKSDGQTLQTNQFAVTRHKKPVLDALSENGMPGVFFVYEFGPVMVKYSEINKSFMHFLTSLCAITGGIFTVSAIIDSLLYHSIKAIQKKIELGKVS
ncbi:endoplasmic reticulum-Golgi intermediate compartment protein 3-like [Oppia nitens]|uniref:endoplasmic reticulum-Golgi intermediate compartment protein 3-like n=1 Tax=Oppia nitens TaxID=1686743 RepID=UPI0023DB13D5|nr:endoplasmic reticulum-Golgi intermediate compartment protein 3-like [Oppia nitens]